MIISGGIFLTALKAANPSTADGQKTAAPGTLPERLLICPWGTSTALDGSKVIVDETTVADLAANQAANGFDEVCLDFNHNTAPLIDDRGDMTKPREPLPVAAYGSLDVIPGEGIYFIPSHWTDDGETYFKGRHYKDLSPTVGRTKQGVVVFIHSIALCRQGEIQSLHAFSANLPDSQTQNTMDPEKEKDKTPDFRALLLTLLGLDTSATDEELVAAAAAKAEKKEDAPASEPAPEPSGDVKALAADFEQFKKDQLVRDAAHDGKVIPLSADQIADMDYKNLSAVVGGLEPGKVPTSRKTADQEEPTDIKALSADEQEICKAMGISHEDFRNANPV